MCKNHKIAYRLQLKNLQWSKLDYEKNWCRSPLLFIMNGQNCCSWSLWSNMPYGNHMNCIDCFGVIYSSNHPRIIMYWPFLLPKSKTINFSNWVSDFFSQKSVISHPKQNPPMLGNNKNLSCTYQQHFGNKPKCCKIPPTWVICYNVNLSRILISRGYQTMTLRK